MKKILGEVAINLVANIVSSFIMGHMQKLESLEWITPPEWIGAWAICAVIIFFVIRAAFASCQKKKEIKEVTERKTGDNSLVQNVSSLGNGNIVNQAVNQNVVFRPNVVAPPKKRKPSFEELTEAHWAIVPEDYGAKTMERDCRFGFDKVFTAIAGDYQFAVASLNGRVYLGDSAFSVYEPALVPDSHIFLIREGAKWNSVLCDKDKLAELYKHVEQTANSPRKFF